MYGSSPRPWSHRATGLRRSSSRATSSSCFRHCPTERRLRVKSGGSAWLRFTSSYARAACHCLYIPYKVRIGHLCALLCIQTFDGGFLESFQVYFVCLQKKNSNRRSSMPLPGEI